MSEEIMEAAADRASMARLAGDVRNLREALIATQNELHAERTKRGTLERAVRAWAVDHTSLADCAECAALHALARGSYADPVLAELEAARPIVAAAAAWREAVETMDGAWAAEQALIAALKARG